MRQPKSKPFPWQCLNCLRREVRPTTIEYIAQVRVGDRLYDVYLPTLAVPRCPACGELIFGNDTDDQINDALYAAYGIKY